MEFFVGLDDVHHAKFIDKVFISVNRLWKRKKDFEVKEWIMDSGAFSELKRHCRYRPERSVENYAAQIRRWKTCGTLHAAVAQDYMCEDYILQKTGLTVKEHQRLTIERYDGLLAQDTGVYIMPVLQGYAPAEYLSHLEQYGARLAFGAWVGVGSVCKRNSSPLAIADVLFAIHGARPDLKLHGFGVKKTALSNACIKKQLTTADSMAWSFAARYEGRNAHDWREAEKYKAHIDENEPPSTLLSLMVS